MQTTSTVPRSAAGSQTAPAEPLPLRIRVLRAANPLVLRLLRSRLHRLMSRDLFVLTVTGRRSGRRYTQPLSYVERDGVLHCCTRPAASAWWKNLRGGADVEIVLRGRLQVARATVADATSEEARDGLRRFLERNPGTSRLLYHVRVAADGSANAEDLAREVSRSIVVRVEPRASGATLR
jgi:deazaflavin-dependent oxidoreductase (nitroreductase family)